jgi:hypothetical protein
LTGNVRAWSGGEKRQDREGRRQRHKVGRRSVTTPKVPTRWIFELF